MITVIRVESWESVLTKEQRRRNNAKWLLLLVFALILFIIFRYG